MAAAERIGALRALGIVVTLGLAITTLTAAGLDHRSTETEPPARDATFTVGERVFLDANGNGIFDEGDSGIAGVSVEVVDPETHLSIADASGIYVAPVFTDDQGRYALTGVPAGDYSLQFVFPEGSHYVPTEVQGDSAIDPAVLFPSRESWNTPLHLRADTLNANLAVVAGEIPVSPDVVDVTEPVPGPGLQGKSLNAASAVSTGAVPVHRFYKLKGERHHFTTSLQERNEILQRWPNTWRYVGAEWGAYETQVDDTVPVYRLYSDRLDAHFLTASAAERDEVLRKWPRDWRSVGVAFYAYPADSELTGTMPIWLFWNNIVGGHVYIADADEVAGIRQKWPSIWIYDGIKFRGAVSDKIPFPYRPCETKQPSGPTTCHGILADGTLGERFVMVTKKFGLPRNYNPGGLTPATQAAWNAMKADAKIATGVDIQILFGYRSYEEQEYWFNYYGRNENRWARPGFSPHQAGTAIDVIPGDTHIKDTVHGKWIIANLHRYGFYQASREKAWQLGYMYEPWHIDFIGHKNALHLKATGLSDIEWLGLPNMTTY